MPFLDTVWNFPFYFELFLALYEIFYAFVAVIFRFCIELIVRFRKFPSFCVVLFGLFIIFLFCGLLSFVVNNVICDASDASYKTDIERQSASLQLPHIGTRIHDQFS